VTDMKKKNVAKTENVIKKGCGLGKGKRTRGATAGKTFLKTRGAKKEGKERQSRNQEEKEKKLGWSTQHRELETERAWTSCK